MKHRMSIGLLILASIVFSLDVFVHLGRPATYDGPTHITTIAQFYANLKEGTFPVRWAAGYGNYGQPLGLYAHQLSSYLGGGLTFVTQNPEISYNLLIAIFSVLSTLALYYFLTLWTTQTSALTAGILFAFSAYRIVNIYIRGALPEFIVTTWIVTSLIALTYIYRNKQLTKAWFLYLASQTLMVLTHPLITLLWTLVVVGVIAYVLILRRYRPAGMLLIMHALGWLLASYYLLPLVIESKYLIIGHETGSLPAPTTPNQYFSPAWNYFSDTSHPGPRENLPKFGLLETGFILVGLILLIFKPDPTIRSEKIAKLLLIITVAVVISTLTPVHRLYGLFGPLAKLQYTYRWFALLIVVPPVVTAYLADRLKRPMFALGLIVIILTLRIPQAYGKNYYQVPLESYQFTPATLHTPNLNTVWMGSWRDYPPKPSEAQIISGEGLITHLSQTNTTKEYQITATGPVRIVDYTFYFPGWQVYAGNQLQPIEFQDPQYRGIITYRLPAGSHHVTMLFQPTKVRLISGYLSLVGIILTLFLYLFRHRSFVTSLFSPL